LETHLRYSEGIQPFDTTHAAVDPTNDTLRPEIPIVISEAVVGAVVFGMMKILSVTKDS
jgi:hypothetical protein